MRSLRRLLLCILLVALHTLVAWPAPGPVPAQAANPTIFSNNFDSQSAGALITGGTPNLFTATTGGSNLSVQTATHNSSPNALSVNVAGGGSFYAEKHYLTHYLQHELSWHLYLGADFTIAAGSYLVLAKLLPSTSSSAGKVCVVLGCVRGAWAGTMATAARRCGGTYGGGAAVRSSTQEGRRATTGTATPCATWMAPAP